MAIGALPLHHSSAKARRPPFAGPASFFAYLGNYSHRVTIGERRIERTDKATGAVTYRYRDYAAGGVKASL